MNFFEGQVLAFDKPYRASSFNVVYGVRNTLSAHMGGRKIKVGHAGTLDPLATGVLLICTGRATKRIEELQQMGKEYVATLKLGATTASYDMEHPENAVFPTEHITEQLVLDTLQRFVARHTADSARLLRLQNRGQTLIPPRTPRKRNTAQAQNAAHRRDRAPQIRHARDNDTRILRQRHIHTRPGPRHRRGARQRSIPYRTAPASG